MEASLADTDIGENKGVTVSRPREMKLTTSLRLVRRLLSIVMGNGRGLHTQRHSGKLIAEDCLKILANNGPGLDLMPAAHIRVPIKCDCNFQFTKAIALLKAHLLAHKQTHPIRPTPSATWLHILAYSVFCLFPPLLSFYLYPSFSIFLSTPLLFLNAPTRTTHKHTRQPDDPCQRFRLSARTPAGLKMGVLKDWLISLPLTVIHLHCSRMTNVRKAYWQLSSFWLAVIWCAQLSEISSCRCGSAFCCPLIRCTHLKN